MHTAGVGNKFNRTLFWQMTTYFRSVRPVGIVLDMQSSTLTGVKVQIFSAALSVTDEKRPKSGPFYFYRNGLEWTEMDLNRPKNCTNTAYFLVCPSTGTANESVILVARIFLKFDLIHGFKT